MASNSASPDAPTLRIFTTQSPVGKISDMESSAAFLPGTRVLGRFCLKAYRRSASPYGIVNSNRRPRKSPISLDLIGWLIGNVAADRLLRARARPPLSENQPDRRQHRHV